MLEPLSSAIWSLWCIAVLNTYVCLFREESMNGVALMQRGLRGRRLRWKDEKRLKRGKSGWEIKAVAKAKKKKKNIFACIVDSRKYCKI